MTYTEIRDLITANETQQGGTDRITGAEVRAVDNAIVDKIEEVEGLVGSGGGGPTIYTADDSLAGNRIIDLAGNTLTISDTNAFLFDLNPVAGYMSFNGGNPSNISFAIGESSNGMDYNGLGNVGSRVVFSTPKFGIGASDPAYYFDIRSSSGGNHHLIIDESAGAERIEANIYSSETPGDFSQLQLSSNSDYGYIFSLNATNSPNSVNITGDAASSTITATADSHIFNGTVIMMADLPTSDPSNPGQLYRTGGNVQVST